MKPILPITLAVLFLSVGCAATPNSVSTDVDASWEVLFPNQVFSDLSLNAVAPSSSEVEVGLTAIYEIELDNTMIGYAFQATVDGDGGRDSVTFRLTIYANAYQGFKVISHREHTAFGVKQFNALTNQLSGTNANFNQIVSILNNANAGRTGISVTYDGIMPAIETMTNRYLAL